MNIYAIKNLLLQANPVSEHHLNRYIKLIEYAIKNPTKEKKFDRHHILPKSMFPEYESFKSNPWNKVKLSKRQHFIAHKILYRAFKNKEMIYSFWMMYITKDGKILKNSKEYEKLQIEVSQISSDRMKSEKYQDIILNNRKKDWTEEDRKIISEKTNNYFSIEENRIKHSEIERSKWNEKYRKYRSELTESQWKNEKYREKQLKVRRKFIYIIEKKSGEIIRTDSLKIWSKENGYNNLYEVLSGKKKFDKDIIKITKELKRG